MEFSIYEVEEKTGKNGQFYLLDTDLGKVYCFPNDYNHDFDEVPSLVGKLVDGGVTAGDFQKFKVFNKVIGNAKMREKKVDNNERISRIACINSAIKIIEASSEEIGMKQTLEEVKKIAEDLFVFINKQ